MVEPATVERALHAIFIAADGTTLRDEDRRKCVEVAALLGELAPRLRPGRVLVDAAAGKAYVGLLAIELLGLTDLVVIERDAGRAALVRAIAGARFPDARVRVEHGDVGDAARWPARPDAVVALHACGEASDRVIDGAIAARARALLLVPCCYAASVPFAARAVARADALGVPRHAEVRRRFVTALIDAERTLRLEAAGYETVVAPLVAPTVTPHNLVWRARWSGEPGRMRASAERLAQLRAPG